ncbi:hypothetical protein A2316_03625 [Candidatus Falkowbacteria bacterium RIFOXYB2_FULL_38_15]|uniref:RNA polymerase sigma factor n=1 Tax=Candidatus Falkowbacteria bacterium RIFOXYA2_FULL_38_12 TaxID=1797993 RepID=A0A1F5S420_9BACT|nr:MAG: hypothetical protein A2257_00290 [Candidatus Falkowbacteria bacterium RIFOXYA2_FULL_38_12]OGF32185.1 MAG: hypothetical protein A2316_03625 [Candidatus Falkowbacteria bacterium RIFOXYB2_FULL_38_15]OGF44605.1 MAG: hypothetical protein A2555_01035 [Candidatus Falkowbacteria bacterium RIFOXYD2_FULL_39_16]
MENYADEQLLESYLNGEKEALDLLIKRYLKPIFGFVFSYIKNSEDAEEITQDAFFKAWKNLKKFDKEKSFKTWLFSIAKNTALDFLKKKKPLLFSAIEKDEKENSIIGEIPEPSPLPDEILNRADLTSELNLAMDKLSPKYREVIFLYYKEQFNFREISELLNEPLDTIKSRHRRAIIDLREILDAPKEEG